MSDSLTFPKNSFTLETASYQGKRVMYRCWREIPYVARPVDVTYQALNVKEPVEIDGKPADCSTAPIFFGIGCAGFLSTTAASGGSFAPPDGGPGGPPMGGPGGPPMGGPGGPPMAGPGGMPPKKASEITSSVEWEAMAGGEGHAGGGIMGIETLGGFQAENFPPPGTLGEDGPMAPDGNRNEMLTRGYVVVEVGCRGRDNQRPDGTYYGKAPAAIVDLKAAVRYLRHNRGIVPGDTEKIITTGGSGGGWMSTLVAASGNCKWFEPYLREIGAAEERDDVFASYSTSPIIDHENADGAVEWQGGALIQDPQKRQWSEQLAKLFVQYLTENRFVGRNGYGVLTGENLGAYIVKEYLGPDCARHLRKLDPEAQKAYLNMRPWIHWDGETAAFDFRDFGTYATRDARVPSFDDLGMEQPGPILYGTEGLDAQHFTDFSLRLATGDPEAKVDQSVVDRCHSVNPTWHIKQKDSTPANYWWIRHGACDACLPVPPAVLLASALEEAGKEVNLRLVWDGGHCADDDHDAFLDYVDKITGHHTPA